VDTYVEEFDPFDERSNASEKREMPNETGESRIERFTAACNNMSVLGLYARHGMTTNTPPKKVMTDVREASRLLLGMSRSFCQKFIEELRPNDPNQSWRQDR